ncbi:hypothetical protein F8M41_016688 [Gigaspora margarita]|uniref:Uncharacterized protein n=1 Tax=Gigaspora margarita TaxID=4874 RepID=A0A8H4AP34_GIGMA|nr:hypothetical protein F8M41_016688 [Gigaspora margarita]
MITEIAELAFAKIQYEITPQYLLPTSENFILSIQFYLIHQTILMYICNILRNNENGGNGGAGALLEELFCKTDTANSTPDVDDMDAYFDEPCSSQHIFKIFIFLNEVVLSVSVDKM